MPTAPSTIFALAAITACAAVFLTLLVQFPVHKLGG